MVALWDVLCGCALGAHPPTREQLLRLESKLISCVARAPADCGLHISYIMRAFDNLPTSWTSLDVVQQLVLQQTGEHRCRYVDTIDASYVGRANYLVAYQPAAPFHQVVRALSTHFYDADGNELPEAADAYVWIDVFALNHHVINGQREYLELSSILDGCVATLLVLDGKCRVLSRLRALYEVWATLQAARKRPGGGPELVLLPSCADPRYLRNALLFLDVRHATTSRDVHKGWMLDQLMGHGVARVNQQIRTAIAHCARGLAASLVERAQQAELEDDVATIVHDLHICALLVQLHGRYTEALQIFKHAVEVTDHHAAQLEGTSPVLLFMHYAELLLLLKEWDAARAVSEHVLQLAFRDGHGGRTQDLLSGAHFSSETSAVERWADSEMVAQVPEPVGLNTPPELPATILLARALMGLGEDAEAENLVRHVCGAEDSRKPKPWLRLRRDEETKRAAVARGAGKARAQVALADILRLKHTHASEAIKLYLTAQRKLTKAVGPEHPEVAYVQMRIGQLLRNEHKLEQAQAVLQRVVELYCRTWGEGHPETASAMVYLADAELAMLEVRDYEFTDAELQSALHKATREYMQAFEVRRACLGINHPDTLATLAAAVVQLLNSSSTRTQLARVEPMCELAVKCSMSVQSVAGTGAGGIAGLEAQETAKKQVSLQVSCLAILGMVLGTAGKAKEAEKMLQNAYSMADADLPRMHQLAAHCLVGLADLYHVMHDWEAADAAYARAATVYGSLLDLLPAPVGGDGGMPGTPNATAGLRGGLGAVSAGFMRGLKRFSRAPAGQSSPGPGGPSGPAAPWHSDGANDRSGGSGGGPGAAVPLASGALARHSEDLGSLRRSRERSFSGASTAVNLAARSSGGGSMTGWTWGMPRPGSRLAPKPEPGDTGAPAAGDGADAGVSLARSSSGWQSAGGLAQPGRSAGQQKLSVVQELVLGSSPATNSPISTMPSVVEGRLSGRSSQLSRQPASLPGSPRAPAALRNAGSAGLMDSAASGPLTLRESRFQMEARRRRSMEIQSSASAGGALMVSESEVAASAVDSGAVPYWGLTRRSLSVQQRSVGGDGVAPSDATAVGPAQTSDGRAARAMKAQASVHSQGAPIGTRRRVSFEAPGIPQHLQALEGAPASDAAAAAGGNSTPTARGAAMGQAVSAGGASPRHHHHHHRAFSSGTLPPLDVTDSGDKGVQGAGARTWRRSTSGGGGGPLKGTTSAPISPDDRPGTASGELVGRIGSETRSSEGTRALAGAASGGPLGPAASATLQASDPTDALSVLVPAFSGGVPAMREPRGSMFGRLAQRTNLAINVMLRREQADQTLAAASLASVDAGLVSRDRLIQAPRMGESLINPHQLVLLRRGKLASRPAQLLRLEACVVLNNRGLLQRWLRGPDECEALLSQALHLALRVSSGTAGTGPLARGDSRIGTAPVPAPILLPVQSNALSVLPDPGGGGMSRSVTTSQVQVWPTDAPKAAAGAPPTAQPLLSAGLVTSGVLSRLSAGLRVITGAGGGGAPPPARSSVSTLLRSSRAETVGGGGTPRAGAGSGSASFPAAAPGGQDPQALHVRALVLSNLAGLNAAHGRVSEAEEMYLLGITLCRQVSRDTDAMLIALNLLTMLSAHRREGQALDVARTHVTPHLGFALGPDAQRRLGGRHHGAGLCAALADVAAGPTPGMAAIAELDSSIRAGSTATNGSDFDLQLQITEALSQRMTDDGGQVLYQWAAEAMAAYEAGLRSSAGAGRPGTPAPPPPRPRLPETLFMLQVPGVHLQCVHMVRWLLLVAFGSGKGLRQGQAGGADAVRLATHVACGTPAAMSSPSRGAAAATTVSAPGDAAALLSAAVAAGAAGLPGEPGQPPMLLATVSEDLVLSGGVDGSGGDSSGGGGASGLRGRPLQSLRVQAVQAAAQAAQASQ